MKWLILLLILPLVAAHGDHAQEGEVLPFGTYLQHIQAWSINLDAGESDQRTLAFSGVKLQENWHVVFKVEVNGTVALRLDEPHASRTWQVTGSGEHILQLSETSWPTLNVTNEGATPVHVVLYFDQTCDCIGKSVPMKAGPLFFNIDARAGDEVTFAFAYIPVRQYFSTPEGDFNGSLDVHVSYMDMAQNLALQEWSYHGNSTQWVDCIGEDRFHGCQTVSFTAQYDGQQILILDTSHNMIGWSVQVHPVIDVQGHDAPLGVFWPLLALVAASVFVAKVRRQ